MIFYLSVYVINLITEVIMKRSGPEELENARNKRQRTNDINNTIAMEEEVVETATQENGIYDRFANNALFSAISFGFIPAIKMLLMAGANVQAIYHGRSALQYAMLTHLNPQRPDIIQTLLDYGADIEAVDQSNRTTLELAIEAGQTETAKVLIQNGANRGEIPDLHSAIFIGDNEKVESLIGNVDLEETYQDMTPLHYAISRKQTEIIETLLANGADQSIEYQGLTPFAHILSLMNKFDTLPYDCQPYLDILKIFFNFEDNKNEMLTAALNSAICHHNTQAALALIKMGADVDGLDSFGMPHLHKAISLNSSSMVKMLLEQQTNTEIINYGMTPLHHAIKDQATEIAMMLLDHGANEDALYQGKTPLQFALEKKDMTVAKALIAKGADKDAIYKNVTLLHNAIKRGDLEEAEFLINEGANLKALYKGMSPLHHAILKGRSEIAALLIQKGANKKALYKGMTPLEHAAILGKALIARTLIKAGAQRGDLSPIHCAILLGNMQKISDWIAAGENINALFQGMTPLHFAIKMQKTEIVNMLIAKGADQNTLYQNLTPLHHAIWYGNEEMVESMLDAGANREIICKNMTPLHYAIEIASHKMTELLINKGANLNALCNGLSPLHLAIKNRYLDSVIRLIDAGANKEILCQNKTPLQFAIERHATNIVKYLIDEGANKEISLKMLRNLRDQDLIDILFPHLLIYGCPLSKLVDDYTFFGSAEARNNFLEAYSPLIFLRNNNLISEVQLAASELLENADRIKKYENSLQTRDENVMADSKVSRANWHFENKVKPHFDATLLNYSQSQNKREAITNIEKEIRALLLKNIVEQALESNNQNIIDFVNQNKDKLIAADDEAMKASVVLFIDNDPAQAAWRGYNPHAKVVANGWPNLLTPPVADEAIFTTRVAHGGELRINEAYEILRERIAYYYLAVIDANDGTDEIRMNRISNFIAQLSDIRNAHGKDDPSCYPGTITRIADMGAFHSIAALPATTKVMIADFFKTKILDLFKEKFAAFSTFEEKEALYKSLMELTYEQAKSVFEYPEQYDEKWLPLRKDFYQALGSANKNVKQIFTQDLFTIVDEDIIYVKQCLLDMAAGESGTAISDYFNAHTDSVPTTEDIQNANPFSADEPSTHELCGLLLEVILKNVPIYTSSLRQLKNLTQYLTLNVPAMLKGKSLATILAAGLEMDAEQQGAVLKAIALLQQKACKETIINPFDGKIEKINDLIKHLPPAQVRIYQNQLKSLVTKQALFNDNLPLVKEAFKDLQLQDDCLMRLTEELASQLAVSGNKLDIDQFCEYLDENDISFINDHKQQLVILAESINGNSQAQENAMSMTI